MVQSIASRFFKKTLRVGVRLAFSTFIKIRTQGGSVPRLERRQLLERGDGGEYSPGGDAAKETRVVRGALLLEVVVHEVRAGNVTNNACTRVEAGRRGRCQPRLERISSDESSEEAKKCWGGV